MKKFINKELVIGAYSYKNPILRNKRGGIKLFIDTLRKFNSTCSIIVVCNINNKNQELEEYLTKNNAKIIYNKFKELHFDDRFVIIKEILLKYKYERILISDMDDAMFQEDPFIIKNNNKLYCSCENSFIDSDNFCGYANRLWLKKYYGGDEEKVKKIYHNKYIICCGTILGDYDNIIQYLEWYSTINTGNKRIIGQALYNIYCYQNPDKCIIINQDYGMILTCGDCKFSDIMKNNNNKLINKNNIVYPILHQMDRWGADVVTLLETTIMQ
tara:strand:- start:297 stop:1109 length:813 start_codon:yes stop_codon:yes gene_type:complete